MNELLGSEALIRVSLFLVFFVSLFVWEILFPRRKSPPIKAFRQVNNLMVLVLNSVLVRLLFPAAAVGVAAYAEAQGWGLMQQWEWPSTLAVLLGFLIMDFAIWGQHLCFHKVPIFWRLHRMHHSDTEVDVTTALRFHPFEIVLSMLIKAALIMALGIPVISVLVFEVVLNTVAMFNHGNVRIPTWLDHWLRKLVVTPDMHRVHHSSIRAETDSNYGFNLPWWDWLFGTYRAQPEKGHTDMQIGLAYFRDKKSARIDQLLAQPLLNHKAAERNERY